jgi:hypothetical protein
MYLDLYFFVNDNYSLLSNYAILHCLDKKKKDYPVLSTSIISNSLLPVPAIVASISSVSEYVSQWVMISK